MRLTFDLPFLTRDAACWVWIKRYRPSTSTVLRLREIRNSRSPSETSVRSFFSNDVTGIIGLYLNPSSPIFVSIPVFDCLAEITYILDIFLSQLLSFGTAKAIGECDWERLMGRRKREGAEGRLLISGQCLLSARILSNSRYDGERWTEKFATAVFERWWQERSWLTSEGFCPGGHGGLWGSSGRDPGLLLSITPDSCAAPPSAWCFLP